MNDFREKNRKKLMQKLGIYLFRILSLLTTDLKQIVGIGKAWKKKKREEKRSRKESCWPSLAIGQRIVKSCTGKKKNKT